jgi:hypothetical protein
MPSHGYREVRAEMAEQVEMRAITDDELAHYEEHGWVMLRELIQRELAAELLAAAQELRATVRSSAEFEQTEYGRQVRTRDWVAFEGSFAETSPSFQARKIGVEPFRSLTFGEAAGRTAQRIMNRGRLTDEPIGVRYLEDALLYKPPGEPEVDAFKMGYHQDQPTFGVDRGGGFNLWIAIDEVRPEQGAMRFLTGSQREGCSAPRAACSPATPGCSTCTSSRRPSTTSPATRPSTTATPSTAHRRTALTSHVGRTSRRTSPRTARSPRTRVSGCREPRTASRSSIRKGTTHSATEEPR